MKIKHICVYGLGGIGGSVGGLLAKKIAEEKNPGFDISFIARGAHLNSINQSGLQLHLPNNDVLLCRPTFASDRMADVPVPDLVFVGVKAYDCLEVARDLQNTIQDHSIIVPLLNGFDIYERMRRYLTKGSICPTSVYFGGRKLAPGQVKLNSAGNVFYGKDPQSERIDEDFVGAVTKLFENTPLNFTYLEDPYAAIWKKYLLNVGLGLVTAYSKRVLGEVLANPQLKGMVIDIMEETAEIARTQYPQLPQDIVANVMALVEKLPYQSQTSYAGDIENNAPKNEGEIFGGAMIDLGQKVGKPVPTIQYVYQKIEEEIARKKVLPRGDNC